MAHWTVSYCNVKVSVCSFKYVKSKEADTQKMIVFWDKLDFPCLPGDVTEGK